MHVCDLCGEAFDTSQGLAGHKQFKHSTKISTGELLVAMDELQTGASPVEISIRHKIHPQTVIEASEWLSRLNEYRLVTVRDLEKMREELMLEVQKIKEKIVSLQKRMTLLELYEMLDIINKKN